MVVASIRGCAMMEERALIGAALTGAPIDELGVLPEHFLDRSLGGIWRAIIRRYNVGDEYDFAAMCYHHPKDVQTLNLCVDSCVAMEGARYYARSVRDAWVRRESAKQMLNITEHLEGGDRISARSAFAQLGDLLDDASASTWEDMEDVARMTEAALRERGERGGRDGVTTGLADLDGLIGGLADGRLYILGARPGMGKTALGLSILTAAAADPRGSGPSVMFSMEMGAAELGERIAVARSGVGSDVVLTGALSDGDMDRYTTAINDMSALDIMIDDTPIRSMSQIARQCRSLSRRRGGVRLVVVDYLQLMELEEHGSGARVAEMGKISRGLKMLAREVDCPVLALSQLNRGLERREDKRPMLADLRESGSIEQDADVVMFLYRDEVYHPMTRDKGTAEIIVEKQRNGPRGRAIVTWDGPTMTLGDNDAL